MSILPVTMKALCRATGALSQAHPIMVQPTCLLHGFRRGWFRALCLLQLLLVKPFAWLGINGNLVVENSMLKTMISAKSLDGFSLGIWRTSVALDHNLHYVGCWMIFHEMKIRDVSPCFTRKGHLQNHFATEIVWSIFRDAHITIKALSRSHLDLPLNHGRLAFRNLRVQPISLLHGFKSRSLRLL